MKTSTITWTSYNNYGTVLQAYSLQQYLYSLGCENVIISDSFLVQSKQKKKVSKNYFVLVINIIRNHFPHFLIITKKFLSVVLDLAYDIFLRGKEKRKDKSFAKFKKKFLNITYKYSFDNLQDISKDFDVTICGSDQIWSVYDGLFDEFYYLKFANNKKISYATSMGCQVIPNEKQERIVACLSDFDSISVREISLMENLEILLKKKIDFVCDPTLLLDRDSWVSFSKVKRSHRKKYVLCYFLDDNPWYQDAVKKYRKKDLDVLLIPCTNKQSAYKYAIKKEVRPQEFISLINNAELVLTDSYHGLLFSLNLKKQFLYFLRFDDNHPLNQNSRIYSILDYLQIKNVVVTKNTAGQEFDVIDYTDIYPRIEEFRNNSRCFLRERLGL